MNTSFKNEIEICKFSETTFKVLLDYINKILLMLINLLDDIEGPDIWKQKFEKNKANFKNMFGFIEDIEYVIKDGNLREKMTLIDILNYLFIDKIYIYLINLEKDGIAIPDYINIDMIRSIIQKIYMYTGLRDKDDLIDLFNSCTGTDICFIKEIFFYPYTDLSILSTRYSGRPAVFPSRISRSDEEKKIDFKFKVEDLSIPLSTEETKSVKFDESGVVTNYDSGASLYKIDENSFFYKLAEKYGKFILTGPSLGVNQLHIMFSTFKLYDPKKFCLLCITYMCPYHHSIFEVLLPCISFGIEYKTSDDDYKFVKKLLDEIDTHSTGGTHDDKKKRQQFKKIPTKRKPTKKRIPTKRTLTKRKREK